jgi:hypothetical protein
MTKPLCARKTPCASCPYRQNVPSGLWAEEEYDKLPAYDGETFEQPMELFMCHQQDGTLCAGWVAYDDPTNLLALRLGAASGIVDECVFDYTTTVPLFPSGAAAAEHGKRDIETPGSRAERAIDKLVRSREVRGLGEASQN